MSRVTLARLLGRDSEARALVVTMAEAFGTPVTVEDNDRRSLHGQPLEDTAMRFPVSLDGTVLGWVCGGESARPIAAMLDQLAVKESERKALGAEVLDLYREVNLMYAFTEKLAALLDLDSVAALTLRQARQSIAATDGVVMMLAESTGELSVLGGFGEILPRLSPVPAGRGVIGSVAATGSGEIVNDLEADPRPSTDLPGLRSLMCAPLKLGERVVGAIAMGSTGAVAYTAGGLKLLSTLALQAATAIENARLFERTVQAARERERLLTLHQDAELARARLDSELVLAAQIQAELFPARMPRLAGYDLAARNRPVRRCGGDYYDALANPEENGAARMLLCVADVSGKGLPASLVMSNMQATLRALLGQRPSLPELAARASDLLHRSTARETYVTAAMLDFAPESGAARYVGAGHVDSLLLRGDGEVSRLRSTGLPLGLLGPGRSYEQVELVLESGDCLVLYSDGVPDALDESEEEFGDERLISVLAAARGESADTVVERVFQAIDSFVGGAPQYDDITLLVLCKL